MSTPQHLRDLRLPGLQLAWPLWLGFVLMMLPVYQRLWLEVWDTEAGAHGPMVLLVCLWVIGQRYPALAALGAQARPRPLLGTLAFALGLLCYLVGIDQAIFALDLAAHVLVPLGLLLLVSGSAGLRLMAFPLGYAAFMFPLPDLLLDAMTGFLQLWISAAAEQLLYLAHYPVARDGVTLTIGSYELMVADVCSGMRSLTMLIALSCCFLRAMGRAFLFHGLLLLLAAIPLAILVNLLRVLLLMLLTYYLGYEAGQGFLHQFAGLVLFVAQVLALVAVDRLLLRLLPPALPQPAVR